MSRITCQRHAHVYGSQELYQFGTTSTLSEHNHFLKALPGWNLSTLRRCALSQGCCFFPPLSYGRCTSGVLPAPSPTQSTWQCSHTLLNPDENSLSPGKLSRFLLHGSGLSLLAFPYTLISLNRVSPRLPGNCVQLSCGGWEALRGRFWNPCW